MVSVRNQIIQNLNNNQRMHMQWIPGLLSSPSRRPGDEASLALTHTSFPGQARATLSFSGPA